MCFVEYFLPRLSKRQRLWGTRYTPLKILLVHPSPPPLSILSGARRTHTEFVSVQNTIRDRPRTCIQNAPRPLKSSTLKVRPRLDLDLRATQHAQLETPHRPAPPCAPCVPASPPPVLSFDRTFHSRLDSFVKTRAATLPRARRRAAARRSRCGRIPAELQARRC